MEYLVIAAITEPKDDLVNKLIKFASTQDCNIEDCRMALFGSEQCVNLLISGSWNAIAKLESHVTSLEKKHSVHFLTQRTKSKQLAGQCIPYTIYITAASGANIIYSVLNFFADQKIMPSQVHSEIYPARSTGTRMLALTLSIHVPKDISIADLREHFLVFCDQKNFDGIIEVERN